LESTEKAAAAADLSAADKLQKRSELLATALQRVESVIGGEALEGSALDKQGRIVKGKVALVGPVAMFAGGETAGVLQQELNKADPTVVQLKEHAAVAGTLASTGSGALLLDPTLGNAFKLAALDESLFDHLKKGGLIMIPLVGMALAVLVVAFIKWLSLSRVRLATEADLQTVLGHVENGDRAKALTYARSIPGMVGGILATAVEHADEKKEYIEEILYEKMLVARARLDRGLAFLALSATTGPLLGLLGTVMGMIATFEAISGAGSGDPKQLAAGISEALVCTATGMAVAIPALLLHAFLGRKTKAIVGSMEHTAVGFINGIPSPERESFTM
jgi:biopolymer transport protein ExbB